MKRKYRQFVLIHWCLTYKPSCSYKEATLALTAIHTTERRHKTNAGRSIGSFPPRFPSRFQRLVEIINDSFIKLLDTHGDQVRRGFA